LDLAPLASTPGSGRSRCRIFYEILALSVPYWDDLAARIAHAPFKAEAPPKIAQKLDAIRRIANTTVDDARPISSDAAARVLNDRLNVAIRASYHHSPNPEAIPLPAQFDPALAARSAPFWRAEGVRLAEEFIAQFEWVPGPCGTGSPESLSSGAQEEILALASYPKGSVKVYCPTNPMND